MTLKPHDFMQPRGATPGPYFKARYQCEVCGGTGYRSRLDASTNAQLRLLMYCAYNCDRGNVPHRLLDVEWSEPIALPTTNRDGSDAAPCLIDGHAFHGDAGAA